MHEQTRFAPEITDADCCRCAEYRREKRGEYGDQQRIGEGIHDTVTFKQLKVPFKSKTAPGSRTAFVERIEYQNIDRSLHEHHD